MHRINKAWLELDGFKRSPLTAADMKALGEKVTEIIQKWRNEEGFLVFVDPTHTRIVTKVGFTFKMFPNNPMIVDTSTIRYSLTSG